MVSHWYKRTIAYHCIYICKFAEGKFIILLLYIDDVLIVGHDNETIGRLKEEMSKSFDKDLGSGR